MPKPPTRITKALSRPVKKGCARRRRLKEHCKRLVALGLPESKVRAMNSQQLRTTIMEMTRKKAGCQS